MRRLIPAFFVLLVIASVLMFLLPTTTPQFSGYIVDPADSPIAGASIQVGDDTAQSDASGYFVIKGSALKSGVYVFNVRKTGYGLLSRRYRTPRLDGRWVLSPGTQQVLPPDSPVGLTDESTGCTQSEALIADFPAYPRRSLPRLSTSLTDADDRVLVAQTLQFLFGGPACSPGARVEIPAGSLVDSNGAPPKTPITATIATVDRYAPDSMAGEGDVISGDNTARIESYGAVTVTMEAAGERLQLAPGKTARITIPVHPAQRSDDLPASIPFLLYDETEGVWTEHAAAELDKQTQSYVASVTHLSTYNTDLVKEDQTCLRINASPLADEAGIEDFELDVFFPVGSGAPEYRNFSITRDTVNNDNLHAIINLPSGEVVTLVASYRDGDNVLPIGIYATNTGAPMPEGIPNDPPYPYGTCSNVVVIEPPASGDDPATLQVNGSAPPGNIRPFHTYSLVKGVDIYPVGDGELYAFGLLDTGADRVVISSRDAEEIWDMPQFGEEAELAKNVSIRVNGLARIDPDTLFAPGFNDELEAELEVAEIELRINPGDTVALIGSPLTSQAIVSIKPYDTITRGPYPFNDQNGEPFSITGMDLAFLGADAELPDTLLSFELEPIERPQSTGTVAPIPALRNVIFEHEQTQFSDTATGRRLLFDTGTQFTIIGPDIIDELGLEPSDAIVDCFPDKPGNEGILIDRIEFPDRNDPARTLRVQPALVCADFADNIIVLSFSLDNGPPRKFDAVIGMAPFINTDMLLHGPQGWLGVNPRPESE